jgi:YggT family protein
MRAPIINIIYDAAQMFFKFLEMLIFVRVLMSWLPMLDRSNPVVSWIYRLTEPILGPIREVLRKSPIGNVGMMLDFSPIIVWLLLEAILSVLSTVIGSL